MTEWCGSNGMYKKGRTYRGMIQKLGEDDLVWVQRPLGMLYLMVRGAVESEIWPPTAKEIKLMRARWQLVRNGYLKYAKRCSSKPIPMFDKASKRMICIMYVRNIDYLLGLRDEPWHPCFETKKKGRR